MYTVYYSFKDQTMIQQKEIISENVGCQWVGFLIIKKNEKKNLLERKYSVIAE